MTWARRLTCAVCAVAASLLLVPGVQAAADGITGIFGSTVVQAGFDAVVQGQDAEDLQGGVLTGSAPTQAFLQEVWQVDGSQQVWADEEGQVVSWLTFGSAEEVFGRVSQSLQDAGWSAVPSGSSVQGTFTKQQGTIHWLFVACSDVSDQVSVVMQAV